MFDTKSSITIMGSVADQGIIPLEMRWPTDQEWDARSRALKNIRKDLGRGKSQTVPAPPGPQDVKLFNTIKLNGAPELTPADAQFVLNLIGQCDVLDVTLQANEVTIQMRILTGIVEHKMRVPSMGQLNEMQRASLHSTSLPYGAIEFSNSMMPGATLYDLSGGHSGDYADGIVPAPHKDVAVRAVIDYVQREFGPRQHDQSF
jgi:hypothetical protein